MGRDEQASVAVEHKIVTVAQIPEAGLYRARYTTRSDNLESQD
jgi:hypothetical protein